MKAQNEEKSPKDSNAGATEKGIARLTMNMEFSRVSDGRMPE